jgi:hypothetical protein
MLWELVVQFAGTDGDTLRVAAPGRVSRHRQVRTWHPLSAAALARVVTSKRHIEAMCMLCPRGDTGTENAVAVTDLRGTVAEVAQLLGWPGGTGETWLLAEAAGLIDPVSAVDSGVSVVIQARDAHDTIDAVVGSVAAAFDALFVQPQWECIVVDNASDVPLRVASRDRRVSVVRLEQWTSRGNARNPGLYQARYQTVLFCDPDVLLPGNYFAAHLPWQCAAPNVITVGTDGRGTWQTMVASAELAKQMLLPPSDPDDIAASCAALGCFIRPVPEAPVLSVRALQPGHRPG